jgi:hypothetical protein
LHEAGDSVTRARATTRKIVVLEHKYKSPERQKSALWALIMQTSKVTRHTEIKLLLLQQLRMMMDCFFSSGREFDLTNNGAFVPDSMSEIPAHICEEYGLRLIVASADDDNHFDIDGECIGTLASCFERYNVNSRFGVGFNNVDGEFYCCTNDSMDFYFISLNLPPHISDSAQIAFRDELRDIVIMQRLKHTC